MNARSPHLTSASFPALPRDLYQQLPRTLLEIGTILVAIGPLILGLIWGIQLSVKERNGKKIKCTGMIISALSLQPPEQTNLTRCLKWGVGKKKKRH